MGYNVHDLLKKVVDYVKLNSALKYMNFWYDFKLASFFKTKLKICKEFVHFYKFIFIKKIIKKKKLTYWCNSNHFS